MRALFQHAYEYRFLVANHPNNLEYYTKGNSSQIAIINEVYL